MLDLESPAVPAADGVAPPPDVEGDEDFMPCLPVTVTLWPTCVSSPVPLRTQVDAIAEDPPLACRGMFPP